MDIAEMLAVSPESGVPFFFGASILALGGSGKGLREQAVDFRPVASRRRARCREKYDGRSGIHHPGRDEREKEFPISFPISGSTPRGSVVGGKRLSMVDTVAKNSNRGGDAVQAGSIGPL